MIIKKDTPNSLELRVFFHSFYSFNATSTLICGKRDAILVSATFLLSDAHRLVAGILETGHNLTHVIIPEFHPDHHFGSGVLSNAFPDAKIVAMQSVARDIVRSAEDKVHMWGNMFGKNVPDSLYFPIPLTNGNLEIEGHAIEISDGWNGDMANETVVWVPSIRALMPSDMVFYYAYPHTIESDVARRQLWKADLKKLQELDPLIVIPGHVPQNKFVPDGTSGIEFTTAYLDAFDEELAKAKTGDELVENMEHRFPDVVTMRYNLHWQARFLFPDSCSENITPVPGIFHTVVATKGGERVYK